MNDREMATVAQSLPRNDTEYENGIRVYVNYGYTDAEVDGIQVPARSYKTVKEAIE